MLKSINALFIRTKDVDRLTSFYQTLGVPLKTSHHGGGLHAEANFGDVHFAIHPWTSSETSAGNVSFSFHVPNLEEYCESLGGKIKFSSPPTPQLFGGVIAELHDPDGNHIFLTRWQTDEEYKRNFPRKG